LYDLKDCTVEKLEVMDFDSSFEPLLWQILGSIGSVGGGLALGKEGPLVHTGACIASVLGQVKS
jgi:H+/Cl- antiporter ClcA